MHNQISRPARGHLVGSVLLSGAALLAFALPSAAQGIVHFGLPHAPLGGASLTPGPGGDLVVANIGSSGQDGVSILLGNSHGWDGWSAPTVVPPNGSIEYTFIGSGPTVTHIPGTGLRITRQGADHLLEVGFHTAGSVTLDAYLHGVSVYHATNHTGTDWIWIPVALYILAHTDAHVEWKSGEGCSGGVSWNSPASVQIPAGPMITCDLLIARPENATVVFDTVETVQITGTNLPQFTLTEERLGALNHANLALGQAALAPGAGQLRVHNIGSSGQDGVRIYPRLLGGLGIGSSGLDGVECALAPLDPSGLAPPGASFTASATGVVDGIPDSDLGSGTITKVASGFELDVDYSPIGATGHVIEIYNQGVLQGTVQGHTGPIASLQSWPRGCGKRFWPIWYPPLWCLWFDFLSAQQFTILGSGGGTFTGTEIRVLAAGSQHTISSLDSFALTGGGLPDITVSAMLDTSATGNYFGTSCPGSLGPPTNRMGALPILGATVPLTIGNMPPFGVGFYILSLTRLNPGNPIPGATGCFQYLPGGVTVLVLANSTGSATFNQVIPNNPAFAGLRIFGQGAVLDQAANPLGITTTNGLFLKIGL